MTQVQVYVVQYTTVWCNLEVSSQGGSCISVVGINYIYTLDRVGGVYMNLLCIS